jgi:phage tail-like protein
MPEYYPPVGFHFKVQVNLDDVATNDAESRFQEVSGLTKNLEIEDFKEGGENRFSHRLPNPTKYGNIVLKRGLLTKSRLITWCADAIDNFSFKPADVTVTLLDEQNNALSTWNIVNAYPVKWSTSDFKAQENGIVVETLELAYQYFTKSD